MIKKSACQVGDSGSIPESERYPGEGNGNPLQFSCLGNPMDRGVWWATYSPWGSQRVGYDLVTKPPPQSIKIVIWPGKGMKLKFCNFLLSAYN